jgi:hypothetical protein
LKIKINEKIGSDELSFIDEIKRLTIIAIVSDDDLMETLVLKGGNAMDIIYNITDRASIDLDFSMSNDFKKDELPLIEDKIKKTLRNTFYTKGYEVFDIIFAPRPRIHKEHTTDFQNDFWGGYRIFFKLIEKPQYDKNKTDLELIRKTAKVVGINGKKTFQIDISKFEYCDQKDKAMLKGYTVYVYTPKMIVFEKLRAICQQMQEYKDIIDTIRPAPRARDFFDIYMLLDKFPFDVTDDKNIELLKIVFETKKVPLKLIQNIREYREFHRLDFPSLKATVRPGFPLKEFDFYFDYVLQTFEKLS